MPETRDLQAVVNAAEHAAAEGDYVSAERLLREVVVLQEAQLGPSHPDLADTLNNLGVVCDFADKPVDAEICYRRAYAIAAAAFEPDHPFVATSRKNLEDFCRIRGRPFEPQIPARPTGVQVETMATDSIPAPDDRASRVALDARAPRRFRRPLLVGALIAGGLVLVVVLSARWWSSSNAPVGSAAAVSTQLPSSTTEPLSAAPKPAVEEAAPPASVATGVGEARLCRNLSTGSSWTCEPPTSPIEAGSLIFYTRVKSEIDSTVEHRWFRRDRLVKAAKLRIRANPTEGYRTYSRQTVDGQGAGDWRVELRAQDGTLVHEERFVVR